LHKSFDTQPRRENNALITHIYSDIEQIMRKKPKTLIFPIFLPMQGCKERCIYCDQNLIASEEPIHAAQQLEQARSFLQAHSGKERQVAFYGGTFTGLEQGKRDALISALKGYLDEEASFRISTHPLFIDEDIIRWCKESGIKTIELGIQDFDEAVLRASGRNYTTEEAVRACEQIKAAGLQLGVQLMPGLPGASFQSMAFNQTQVEKLKPNFLRLYPVIVIRGTELHQMWLRGEYQPLSLEEAVDQCASWQQVCERAGVKIIKMGLPSQMDQSSIVAGPWHPAFGQLVQTELLLRTLEQKYEPDSIIKLDKNQWALIMANNKMYLEVLQRRLPGCQVELIVSDSAKARQSK
jgi:histone acetyltransferase (RNA polymerase elongator complex component)